MGHGVFAAAPDRVWINAAPYVVGVSQMQLRCDSSQLRAARLPVDVLEEAVVQHQLRPPAFTPIIYLYELLYKLVVLTGRPSRQQPLEMPEAPVGSHRFTGEKVPVARHHRSCHPPPVTCALVKEGWRFCWFDHAAVAIFINDICGQQIRVVQLILAENAARI